MTDLVERPLSETFHEAALEAPVPGDLTRTARAAVLRRNRHQNRHQNWDRNWQQNRHRNQYRRRLVTGAASVLTGAVIVGMFLITQERETTAQSAEPVPLFSGPLTREECPGNRAGGTGGFFTGDTLPPAREQAELFGRVSVLPEHPDARLVGVGTTEQRREFAYVRPNGYRVGVIEFVRVDAGWYLEGKAWC